MTDTKLPRIMEAPEGFYFVLNGVLHGFWVARAIVVMGRKIEMLRASARIAF